MKLKEVKNCIFDVNGVLIDSNVANARAMAEAFTDDAGLRKRIAELYLTLTGIDRGTKIRRIQENIICRPFHEGEFELRWQRFKNLSGNGMRGARLMPGCKEVLDELKKRRIHRIALSNTPLKELKNGLSAHGLEHRFEIIRGGGDWTKSESLRCLLEEFHFNPVQCLFIGDGKGDLAAAGLAGISFVAIDPGTDEFAGETGFDGPYIDLCHWGKAISLIQF
ncbi:MAG TPA: HAD hydrolase-like protein [Desulfobacterales bacterium]|nr:HAD hydrolase-like protein [Desulfobacterales bacterium]